MAIRRHRRADELTPKLHYRPGVVDPDLEETIVSFYRPTDLPARTVPFPAPTPGDASSPGDINLLANKSRRRGLSSANLAATPGDVSSPGDETECINIKGASRQDFPSPTHFEVLTVVIPSGETSAGGVRTPGDDTTPGDASSPGVVSDLHTIGIVPSSRRRRAISQDESFRRASSEERLFYKTSSGKLVESKRVQRCTLVQHGHSPTEQLIYQLLWSWGRNGSDGQTEKDLFRETQAGYDKLANQSGITKRNVLEIMHRLREKLAIEVLREQDSARNIARVYKVNGMALLLDRRREAGMVNVVRHKGVDFVFPVEQNTLPNTNTSPGDVLSPDVTTSPGDVPSPPPGDLSSPSPGDASSPPLGKKLRKTSGRKPSTWPVAVRALIESTGYGDDDAISQIAEACLTHAADATDEEIAHFIREEAPRYVRDKAVRNPIGMLIRQVPRRFVGESFRLYREAVQKSREAELQQRQRWVREAELILSETTSSEEDRLWAKTMLDMA